MPLEFISLVDDTGRTSSLQINPETLTVIGVLPHGTEIRLRGSEDSEKLREWLDNLMGLDAASNPEDGEEGEVPNLDGMDQEDLWDFWKTYQRGKNYRELFPDGGEGTKNATQDLANYAANKATAMGLRAEGEIEKAVAYEDIADRIYDDLPEWAQW